MNLKIIHIVFEALAVFVLIPYFIYLSFQVAGLNKVALLSIAAMTLVVDGGLLLHYLTT